MKKIVVGSVMLVAVAATVFGQRGESIPVSGVTVETSVTRTELAQVAVASIRPIMSVYQFRDSSWIVQAEVLDTTTNIVGRERVIITKAQLVQKLGTTNIMDCTVGQMYDALVAVGLQTVTNRIQSASVTNH